MCKPTFNKNTYKYFIKREIERCCFYLAKNCDNAATKMVHDGPLFAVIEKVFKF